MKVLLLSAGTGGGEMFYVLSECLKTKTDIETFNVSITDTAKKVNPSSKLLTSIPQVISLSPDIILYETSNDCRFRDELLGVFKGKCPTVSIMDVFDSDNRRFAKIVPDLICAPTPTIEAEMRAFGYTNTWTYTNPAFSKLEKFKAENRPKKECIKVLYASQGESFRVYMNDVLSKISDINVPVEVHIKPHPEESLKDDLLLELYQRVSDFDPELESDEVKAEYIETGIYRITKFLDINTFPDIESLLSDYDLVIGMHSTLQIKAMMMGIPTIFYEFNLGQIEKAINQEPFELNYKYEDFKECASVRYFESKTEELLLRMKKLIQNKY